MLAKPYNHRIELFLHFAFMLVLWVIYSGQFLASQRESSEATASAMEHVRQNTENKVANLPLTIPSQSSSMNRTRWSAVTLVLITAVVLLRPSCRELVRYYRRVYWRTDSRLDPP